MYIWIIELLLRHEDQDRLEIDGIGGKQCTSSFDRWAIESTKIVWARMIGMVGIVGRADRAIHGWISLSDRPTSSGAADLIVPSRLIEDALR